LTTWLADRRGSIGLETLREICPFEVTMRGIVREEYDWVVGTMSYWEDCEWRPVENVRS
jgi:hypothetical protein